MFRLGQAEFPKCSLWFGLEDVTVEETLDEFSEKRVTAANLVPGFTYMYSGDCKMKFLCAEVDNKW